MNVPTLSFELDGLLPLPVLRLRANQSPIATEEENACHEWLITGNIYRLRFEVTYTRSSRKEHPRIQSGSWIGRGPWDKSMNALNPWEKFSAVGGFRASPRPLRLGANRPPSPTGAESAFQKWLITGHIFSPHLEEPRAVTSTLSSALVDCAG